jgi:FecR protein
MNEDYLWRREGEPDPEVQRLEQCLEAFRYHPSAFTGWRANSQAQPPVRLLKSPRTIAPWAATAAAILIALTWYAGSRYSGGNQHARESGWIVSWSNSTSHALTRGQTIETGEHLAAHLSSPTVGEIEVDPSSRLRLLQAKQGEHRLELERGAIHAFIWAPPRHFLVNTPSATTVDLGCQYSLKVAPDGTGTLRVETGWVAFEWKHRESFIPAGATCLTRPGRGPGTPSFDDAPAELRQALSGFDEHGDDMDLRRALVAARPRDALSIWHLLTRTHDSERARVFARLSELVKVPPAVTEERILSGDPAAIDETWDALNLGDTTWWRRWKRAW